MNLAKLKRRVWFRYAMRGSGQNDPYKQLNRLYFIRDPWAIDTPGELPRIQTTNDAVQKAFGHVDTMLEVGAGEGVQSQHLAKLCNHLTGIDVSPRAIARARKRAARHFPGATFNPGDLGSQPWADEADKFDVVVAAEVLYYMSDPKAFLDRITRLAKRGWLLTNYAMNDAKLGPLVRNDPRIQMGTITYGDNSEKKSYSAWYVKP